MLNFYNMQAQSSSSKEVTYTFQVDPMMCGNCVRAVTVALAQLNCPSLKLQSNISQKAIQVVVPEAISAQDIISALSQKQITATLFADTEQPQRSIHQLK